MNEGITMQAKAIKFKQGWYIQNLPGFEEIKADMIDIDVELTHDQFKKLDYKELKGIGIMERYFEKRQKEVIESKNTIELRANFRQQFGIASGRFAALVRDISVQNAMFATGIL
jgi:hypothetical protein